MHRTHLLALPTSATDSELLAQMRAMEASRKSGVKYVALTIFGFDSDPRELWQIPEVQAFCRRLVDIGLIGLLDLALHTAEDPSVHMYWGGLMVWACAEGLLRASITLNPKQQEQFWGALAAAKTKAEAALRA